MRKVRNGGSKYWGAQRLCLGASSVSFFINDLPNATKFSATLFADDTFLSLESSDIAQLQIDVNTEIKKVYDWLVVNKLTLNVIKSKFKLRSFSQKRGVLIKMNSN